MAKARHTFVILSLMLLGLPAMAQDMTVPPPDDLKTWRKVAYEDAGSSSTCIGRIDNLSCALDTALACQFRGDPALCGLAYRASTVRGETEAGAPPDAIWIYKLRGAAIYKGGELLNTLGAISENGFNVYAPFVLNSMRKPRTGDALIAIDRVPCYSPRTAAECMEEGWRDRNVVSPETLVFRLLPGQGWQAVGDRMEDEQVAALLEPHRARDPNLPPADPPGTWRQIWRDPAGHPDACDGKTDSVLCANESRQICYLRVDPAKCARSGYSVTDLEFRQRMRDVLLVYRLRGAVIYRGEEYPEAIEPLLGYYVDPFYMRYMKLGEIRQGDILLGVESHLCKTADIPACIADAEESLNNGNTPGIVIVRRDRHGWYAIGIGGPID